MSVWELFHGIGLSDAGTATDSFRTQSRSERGRAESGRICPGLCQYQDVGISRHAARWVAPEPMKTGDCLQPRIAPALIFSEQGLAMPCCMVGTPDRATLGDMAADGDSAVWNGDAYRGFRAAPSSDSPPDVCRSCAIYSGTF